jgi:nicotinic acid mononucleotide adenylyltransferase
MKELIENINLSNTLLRILEVGAGVPISNEFFNYSGASKTIYSTESYYSREAFDKKFNNDVDISFRAVSAERLKNINDNSDIDYDICCGLYNTVLSTTFQVGDIDNKTSTHGWISIFTENKTRYYHISLHYSNDRISHIKKIGDIGIKLLHGFINDIIHDNTFVDIVLDEDLKPLYKETLEYISMCKESISIFTKNKNVDRLESITRDVNNLIVYKGSFNPPSLSHIEIVETTKKLYDNEKSVFCLSYNTRNKGIQTVESFMDRIEYLNILGYDVIVMNNPLFIDTYDIIRTKYKNKIIFPMGIDTINRIVFDITKGVENGHFFKKDFEESFKNFDFVIFHRINEILDNMFKIYSENKENIKFIDDNKHVDVSSTIIRQLISENRLEEIKSLIPIEIYQKIIEKI